MECSHCQTRTSIQTHPQTKMGSIVICRTVHTAQTPTQTSIDSCWTHFCLCFWIGVCVCVWQYEHTKTADPSAIKSSASLMLVNKYELIVIIGSSFFLEFWKKLLFLWRGKFTTSTVAAMQTYILCPMFEPNHQRWRWKSSVPNV